MTHMITPLISLKNAGITYKTHTGLFSAKYFKALQNINLDIMAGETLGVIGANGSGKSTLLKLLARIYQPDFGTVRYRAKNVSLLSLSLGFNGELSARDNAILSSMLLGASFKEANQKLEKIIEFAELETFADNPLKTYSSGMRSRLGFSVALHMHTDVILIDEALAVGDAHFKAKSENALAKKISSDQTVVLVSHSAAQIIKLCDRAIWLKDGLIMGAGKPAKIADEYNNSI
jgi:lipopolysaccharide transport system ATP-binding protein